MLTEFNLVVCYDVESRPALCAYCLRCVAWSVSAECDHNLVLNFASFFGMCLSVNAQESLKVGSELNHLTPIGDCLDLQFCNHLLFCRIQFGNKTCNFKVKPFDAYNTNASGILSIE